MCAWGEQKKRSTNRNTPTSPPLCPSSCVFADQSVVCCVLAPGRRVEPRVRRARGDRVWLCPLSVFEALFWYPIVRAFFCFVFGASCLHTRKGPFLGRRAPFLIATINPARGHSIGPAVNQPSTGGTGSVCAVAFATKTATKARLV